MHLQNVLLGNQILISVGAIEFKYCSDHYMGGRSITTSKDKEGYQHRRCYRGCVILLGLVWFTPESVIKEPNQIIMQSQLSLVEDLSAHS